MFSMTFSQFCISRKKLIIKEQNDKLEVQACCVLFSTSQTNGRVPGCPGHESEQVIMLVLNFIG